MNVKKPLNGGKITTGPLKDPVIPCSNEYYVLRLYIAGLTPRSTCALERIRKICDQYLAGRYELTVIDLYQHPEEARLAQVVVVPTLVKHLPSPMRFFVGDMADEKRILLGLNIAT